MKRDEFTDMMRRGETSILERGFYVIAAVFITLFLLWVLT
jgi:hypothetical protein